MFSRRDRARVLFTFILPREAGKGDRPAEQDGGRGVGRAASSIAAAPSTAQTP
jgi:hypothetical protein